MMDVDTISDPIPMGTSAKVLVDVFLRKYDKKQILVCWPKWCMFKWSTSKFADTTIRFCFILYE